jgi:hypothetical protein
MSFSRLVLLVLPLVLGLPLLTGGCGAPTAVAAASYGADGVSLAESGKTTGDHFTSMVTKKDCAFWRVLRGQKICYERQGDRDPYQVNYSEPFRDQSEGGGIEYHAPLRAAPDAPVSSWDAAAYKPQPEQPKPQPPTAVAEGVAPPAPEPAAATPAPSPKTKKPKGDHSAAKAKSKDKVKKIKPSPDQAAAVP